MSSTEELVSNESSTDKVLHEEHGDTNFIQTLMNILKGNIGIGVLALPMAVSNAGSVLGPFIMIGIGLLVLYNMISLCDSNYNLRQKNNKFKLGYAGTVKYAISPYVKPNVSPYIGYMINTFLLTYQTLSCAGYVIVAAETLQEITYGHFSDIREWIVMFIFPIILLSCISRIDTLSIISGYANILCIFSLLATLSYIFPKVKRPNSYPYIESISSIPSCLCTVIFAYEGMSSMLPIINSMKNRAHYARVLITSSIVTIVLYTTLGWFGYLAFGSTVRSPVTLGLPINAFYNSIKIIYSLGVLLSFLVILYCNVTIIMPTVSKYVGVNKYKILLAEFILRVIIIMSGISMALILPHFDNILSLMGAFGSCPISLIIPPIVHILTFYKEENIIPKWRNIKLTINIIIIIVGVALTIICIYSTITDISSKK